MHYCCLECVGQAARVHGQGSETRVTHLKTLQKNHPNPVSFLVLLITKGFIMFKALEKL